MNIEYNRMYEYSGVQPHAIDYIYDDTEGREFKYDWDANGNMISQHRPELTETGRNLCWDEENRLAAVKDNRALSGYIYNAGGERTWKITGHVEQMTENGDVIIDMVDLHNKVLYASPYMVVSNQEYTKHYYMEDQRISSRIGSGFGDAPVNPLEPSQSSDFLDWDAAEISYMLWEQLMGGFDCAGLNPGDLNYEPVLDVIHVLAEERGAEPAQYFYHSDHLGSSAFITRADGDIEQHLQYMPFGETFIDQRMDEWSSRYTFSAKEKDPATSYNYFGARYYDSEVSVWLSVDPMSDERSWISPYNYVQWNPLNRIDPTGLLDQVDDFYFDQDGKLTKYVENDEPDRVYVATGNKNVDPDDPNKVPEPEFKQVEMSAEEIEQKMDENGYKKVDSKILQAEFTMTASSGNLNVSSSRSVEVVLDTKYTRKQNELIDSRALKYYKYEPEIGPINSTAICKRQLIYGEKSIGNKFVDFLIKINSINNGNLSLTPIIYRYSSMDDLPQQYEFLKNYKYE